jgi:hypothetical protein
MSVRWLCRKLRQVGEGTLGRCRACKHRFGGTLCLRDLYMELRLAAEPSAKGQNWRDASN